MIAPTRDHVRVADTTEPGRPGEHVEIQVTCGSREEADTIADALVDGRLAACVQQVPVRSIYRWEGAVEHDDEILLLVKTRRDRYDAVEAAVLAGHSYDVPAITCVDIVGGSADYLAWIDAETGG
jgi:periplasmic divalent cation tolerance protein